MDANQVITVGGVIPIGRKYVAEAREQWDSIKSNIYNISGKKRIELKEQDFEKNPKDELLISGNDDPETISDIKTSAFENNTPFVEGNHGTIIGIKGILQNVSFRIYPGEEVVIGRDSNRCQIIIKDKQISRVHCGLSYDTSEQCYYLIDYSTNGTFVENKGRIDANKWQKLSRDTRVYLAYEDCAFILV